MRLAPLALILATAATAATAHAAPIAWSPTEQGVHARLIAEPATDAQKHAQIAIAVEIENVSDVGGGLPLPWGDIQEMLTLTVEDAAGNELPQAAMTGNRISPLPYIVMVPERSTMRVQVTPGAFEYIPGGRSWFRPMTFAAWELPAKHGPLFIRATLSPRAQEKGTKMPPRSWSTPLALPRVALP